MGSKNLSRIATILRIEPDHLNIHRDLADYIAAKANITTHQTPNDYLIYYEKIPTLASLPKSQQKKSLIQSSHKPLKTLLSALISSPNSSSSALITKKTPLPPCSPLIHSFLTASTIFLKLTKPLFAMHFTPLNPSLIALSLSEA